MSSKRFQWCARKFLVPSSAALFISTLSFAADHSLPVDSFKVPTPQTGVPSIAAATTGDMWFVESTANKLGTVNPAGIITEIPIPADMGLDTPIGIAEGTDNRMWFMTQGNLIGAVTASGTFEKYQTLSPNGGAVSPIVSGSDKRLYFFEQQVNKIGAITTSGTASEYAIPTAKAEASALTAGPDGNIWFTELGGNRIGRLTVSGSIAEFPLPVAQSRPSAITAGPDGNLWFVESRCPACEIDGTGAVEVIGRITPSGTIAEFEVESTRGKGTFSPHEGIVSGADGALWFTESLNNKIGRISTSGEISEFDLPVASIPEWESLAVSADGHLWIASSYGDHADLYRIATSPAAGITSGMTGSWYDPNESGQGFNIEVLAGNILAVYWYSFAPDGKPLWITASGPYSSGTVELDGYQIVGSGAKFPPYFDPKNVHAQRWGSMTFTFSDCQHAQVSWNSDLPNYGTGSMNLVQFTQAIETACP